MSDLSPERQRHFRERLRQRQHELESDINRERDKQESWQTQASEVPDPGDASVADLSQTLDQAEVGRDLSELRGVIAALGRLETGEYGICSACGMRIRDERLDANPAAERCIDCQRRHEQTHGTAPHELTL